MPHIEVRLSFPLSVTDALRFKSFNLLRTSTLEGGGRVLHTESISGGGAGMGMVMLELDSQSSKNCSRSLLSKSLKGSTSSMAIVKNVSVGQVKFSL